MCMLVDATHLCRDIVCSTRKCVIQILSFESQFMQSCVPTDEVNQYKEVGKQYGMNLLLLVITTVAARPLM